MWVSIHSLLRDPTEQKSRGKVHKRALLEQECPSSPALRIRSLGLGQLHKQASSSQAFLLGLNYTTDFPGSPAREWRIIPYGEPVPIINLLLPI